MRLADFIILTIKSIRTLFKLTNQERSSGSR